MTETLSDAERKEIMEDHLAEERFSEYWNEHAQALMRKYGGEWVLFQGTNVVGHSENPSKLAALRRKLDAKKPRLSLRYVPRIGERFVL